MDSTTQIAGVVAVVSTFGALKFLFEMRKAVDEYRDTVVTSKAYTEDQDRREKAIFDRVAREYTTICAHLELKSRVKEIATHQTGRLASESGAVPRVSA